MTSDADFLAEIRARPLVDAARLAYADWLEEQGDVRAGYLRTSVELVRGKHSTGEVEEKTNALRELAVTLDPVWRASAGVRVDVEVQSLLRGNVPVARAVIAATGNKLPYAHRFTNGSGVTLWHGMLREALPDVLIHFTKLGKTETDGRVWVISGGDEPLCKLVTTRASRKRASGWPRRVTYGDGHSVQSEVTDVPPSERERVARVMAAVSKRSVEEIADDLASGRCIVTEGIDDLAKTFSRNFAPPLFVDGKFMYGHVCSVTYQSPTPAGLLDV